jgi:hypothetical protein
MKNSCGANKCSSFMKSQKDRKNADRFGIKDGGPGSGPHPGQGHVGEHRESTTSAQRQVERKKQMQMNVHERLKKAAGSGAVKVHPSNRNPKEY